MWLEGLTEMTKILRTIGRQAEILIRDLPNTDQEFSPLERNVLYQHQL
jgi:hypothetical protein